jgi:hypothetical protein
MSVIVNQNNPDYFELRAIEMIDEARLSLGVGPEKNDLQMQQYHLKMTQAISLLGLARASRGRYEEHGAP